MPTLTSQPRGSSFKTGSEERLESRIEPIWFSSIPLTGSSQACSWDLTRGRIRLTARAVTTTDVAPTVAK